MQNNASNSNKNDFTTIEEATLITMSKPMSGACFLVTRAW